MQENDLKRILLTGDTAGGVWTFTLELAAGLISRSYEVCLASFGPSVSHLQVVQASNISGLRWLHHASKLEWMIEPWDEIRGAGRWLRQIVNQERPDLIHLNTLCHADLPWEVPVVTTVHSSVAAWWEAVKGSVLPSTWLRYQTEVKSSVAAATLLTAPSQSALVDVRKHFAAELGDTFVINNGIDPGPFQNSGKEPFIFAAGRLWDEAKNIIALASLAPHLEWPVYLAGDIGRQATDTRAFNDCHLLGHLSTTELAKWYSRAAIYVLPARYEPFGLSILEAALSGCALVLGDIPSLREIWLDNAVFVNPDDTRALRTALTMLIEDSNYREEMSRRAAARASEFSQSRMASEYIAAYQLARQLHLTENRRLACVS